MNSKSLQAVLLALGLSSATLLTGAGAGGLEDAIEIVGPGTVNWTTGVVMAQGIGAPPANAVNAAQARAMAERAAFSVAVRNLLEAVKGVRVDSATLVENMMVTNDVIKTRVSGIVRGARSIKTEHLPDGSVEVTVGISLTGEFFDTVLPKKFGRSPSVSGPALPVESMPSPVPPTQPVPPATTVPAPPLPPPAQSTARTPPPPASASAIPSPPPVPAQPASPARSTEGYTGLLVDARGLGLKPALVPRLLDGQGNELYAGEVLAREQAVQAGVTGYSKDLVAGSRQPRVTDNPLIVKGVKASGSKSTDIILSEDGARTIQETEPVSHYLRQGRVVLVYD